MVGFDLRYVIIWRKDGLTTRSLRRKRGQQPPLVATGDAPVGALLHTLLLNLCTGTNRVSGTDQSCSNGNFKSGTLLGIRPKEPLTHGTLFQFPDNPNAMDS